MSMLVTTPGMSSALLRSSCIPMRSVRRAQWSSTSAGYDQILARQTKSQWGWPRPRRNRILYITGASGLLVTGLLVARPQRQIDQDDISDLRQLRTVPFSKLCSGWIAFAFCSSPSWVDMSESLYGVVSRIPGVASIAHAFTMQTFFNQFLGGETTADCVAKIEDLRERRIGTLLGYNIEAELDGSSKDPELILKQTQHVLASIDTQGDLAKKFWPNTSASSGDNRFWVRIKITGLLPQPEALRRGSNAILKARDSKGLNGSIPYPGIPQDGDWNAALNGEGVTNSDREQLLNLRSTMEAIASKARDNNVRIVIDGEQTWYQPVIDSLTDELMQKYNTLDGPATCIATFQAYLRRHPDLLRQQIQRAEDKGYKLLFKQVRGAYMVTEAKRWKDEQREGQSPVWASKAETDRSFDYGVALTLSTISEQIKQTGHSRIGAVFATHNSFSIDKAIDGLKSHALAHTRKDGRLEVPTEVAGSIAFAQLYGMKDDLTNKITGMLTTEGDFPLVVKSMSYGDLKECLPFLARRAIENKSVLEGRGGAVEERARLGREIRRRLRLSNAPVS